MVTQAPDAIFITLPSDWFSRMISKVSLAPAPQTGVLMCNIIHTINLRSCLCKLQTHNTRQITTHPLPSRCRSSLDPSVEAGHETLHSTGFALQTARATASPPENFPRSRSSEGLHSLSARETRTAYPPRQTLRRSLSFPKLQAGADPYAAWAAAIRQPTERASSPTPSQPSSVVTCESLLPGLKPQNSFEEKLKPQNSFVEKKPQPEELQEEKRFAEHPSFLGGVLRAGYAGRGFEQGGFAQVSAPGRATMQAVGFREPSGVVRERPMFEVWDLNSEEQAIAQAAGECGGARARARALAYPPGAFRMYDTAEPAAHAPESARFDLGFGKEGRKRDFGMTMPRSDLAAAVRSAAPQERCPIPAEVAGGIMAAAAGRARPPYEAERRRGAIWNVVDPRSGMTVGMWGTPLRVPSAPRPPSAPFAQILPHSGGLFFGGPVNPAETPLATGTDRLAVLAEAAGRASDGGAAAAGANRGAGAVGGSYRGGNLMAALGANQQPAYLEETSIHGRALMAGTDPRALMPPQRSPGLEPGISPEVLLQARAAAAAGPWPAQRKPFSIPPPLKLEQEMRLARSGTKRGESGDEGTWPPLFFVSFGTVLCHISKAHGCIRYLIPHIGHCFCKWIPLSKMMRSWKFNIPLRSLRY